MMTALEKFRSRHGLAALALLGVIATAGAVAQERMSEGGVTVLGHQSQALHTNGDPNWPLPDEPLDFQQLEASRAESVLARLEGSLQDDIQAIEASFDAIHAAMFTIGEQTSPEIRKARFEGIVSDTLSKLADGEAERSQWSYMTIAEPAGEKRDYLVDYATRVSRTKLIIDNIQDDLEEVLGHMRAERYQEAALAYGGVHDQLAIYEDMYSRPGLR